MKDLQQILNSDPSTSMLTARGAEYPPPPLMVLLADALMMVQITILVALFIKNKALPAAVSNNKMVTIFALWLGGSTLSSMLTKTNSFEIYLGSKFVWSSIEHARMPELKDLIESFKAAGVTLKLPTQA